MTNADKPLPDCTNCAGCTTGGNCGGCPTCGPDGCTSRCGNRRATDHDTDEGPLGKTPGGTPSDFKFNADREPRGKIFATDWLDSISTSADFPAVQVQFKNTRNGFYANPQKLNLEIGDMVAVEGSPGHDIGRVSMVGPLVRLQMRKNRIDPDSELKKVFRKATDPDLDRFDQARAREHDTMIRSRVIAEELGLNMKIGDVEYQGDGSKAIFYYIADERVDFRKLIRLLADEFHVRIEMKQIGARQEAGRIGGIGPCGRPLCCSSWMTHFVSVGTGSARMQDLSMNPQKLAGQCAKLKCCLNFEIDSYAEASRKLPPKDVVLQTKDSDHYYAKADILQRLVTYSTDRKVLANLVTIPAERAFEVIALNKQGVKPDRLSAEPEAEPEAREYIDLTDQDSLTRFDKSRQKKRKQNLSRKGEQTKPNAGKQEVPGSQNGAKATKPAATPKEGPAGKNRHPGPQQRKPADDSKPSQREQQPRERDQKSRERGQQASGRSQRNRERNQKPREREPKPKE